MIVASQRIADVIFVAHIASVGNGRPTPAKSPNTTA